MFSFTKIVVALFAIYLCNIAYVVYTLFYPETCNPYINQQCIDSAYTYNQLAELKVSVYITRFSKCKPSDMDLIWDSGGASVLHSQDIDVNITLPFSTRRNGSLYACTFVHPKDESPYQSLHTKSVYQIHSLSKYIVPKGKEFNLIQGTKDKDTDVPITHLNPKLSIYLATQNMSFNRQAVPSDLHAMFSLNSNHDYLPFLYIDGLSALDRKFKPISRNTSEFRLKIYFTPVSIGRLRIWTSVQQSLISLKEMGFKENDLDDLKGMFTDTNLYFLALTFFIALMHGLFDLLAFKNDVSFWRQKENMEGMSTRSVVWRSISTTIIFLYLLDQKTNLLVLVPCGVGAIIEYWKVKKALKIELYFDGYIPKMKFGEKSASEKQTQAFDQQAMQYLSYGLYPLLFAGSVYSLFYQPHKSWYSWVVRSMVNGVYAFGFLFMLPQLFVNYKLKSVAHLPWRAFMYKAFNTFIDDVFAFIITMPTAHRLACFRDDLVFLVYLYQRWLYPVDKTRANEYGMVFEKKDTTQEEIDQILKESKKDQ